MPQLATSRQQLFSTAKKIYFDTKATMGHKRSVTRVPKDREIKARVDSRTKAELEQLAYARNLQLSDILREAVRDHLAAQRRQPLTPSEFQPGLGL